MKAERKNKVDKLKGFFKGLSSYFKTAEEASQASSASMKNTVEGLKDINNLLMSVIGSWKLFPDFSPSQLPNLSVRVQDLPG